MEHSQLYLIRHAESVLNTQAEIIGGRSNESPLTPRGIGQARQLGRYLLGKNIFPTYVHASPAIRTIQTAHLSLEEMGVSVDDIIIGEELQELHQGEWVGRNRYETYTDEAVAEIAALKKDFKAPGGESMNEVGERMAQKLDTITIGDEPETLFVYTHGLAIRCYLSSKFGWTHRKTRLTKTPNASLTRLDYIQGDWRLRYHGRSTQSN